MSDPSLAADPPNFQITYGLKAYPGQAFNPANAVLPNSTADPFVEHIKVLGPSSPKMGLNNLEADPTKDLTELSAISSQLGLEDMHLISFIDAYNAFLPVGEHPHDIGQGIPEQWDSAAVNTLAAADDFTGSLQQLDSAPIKSPTRWSGATQQAAVKKLHDAIPALHNVGTGATNMGTVSLAFATTLATVSQQLKLNYPSYHQNMTLFPQSSDTIRAAYNKFAREVMSHYQNNMLAIAHNSPGFSAAPAAAAHGRPGGAGPSGGGAGGAGLPGGGAGGLGLPGGAGGALPGLGDGAGGLGPDAGLGPSSDPQLTGLTDPQGAGASPIPATGASAASPASDAGSMLPELAQGATAPLEGATQGLGQAMNAAQRGNNPALGGANSAGKLPPPGKLDLGDKGLKGSAGGPGAGPGALGKSAGAPGAAATAARTAPAGARAGLSNALGSPAAGAPAAGAPGAGQKQGDTKGTHQANKVLRQKKNGEELIGETEAVVPVLGAPAQAETAKADAG